MPGVTEFFAVRYGVEQRVFNRGGVKWLMHNNILSNRKDMASGLP